MFKKKIIVLIIWFDNTFESDQMIFLNLVAKIQLWNVVKGVPEYKNSLAMSDAVSYITTTLSVLLINYICIQNHFHLSKASVNL